MRQIKFRAWNIAAKKMIDLKKITPLALNMDTDGLFIPFSDGLPLMQFTGLHDKNGKEIYEGDIVRQWQLDSWDKENDKAVLVPTDSVSFVEYRTHGFWIEEESFGWEGEGLWHWDMLEILGNIFEHPNLIDNPKTKSNE